jgi:hypothetical protein
MEAIVLIDKPRESWKNHSHMVSNDISFLHEFARKIGVKRYMFSNKKGKNKPHYDVHEKYFHKAVDNGAKVVPSSEIVRFLNEHYK